MKKHLLKLSSFASLPLLSLAAVSCSNNQNIPPVDYEMIDEKYGLAFNSTGEITRYISYPGNNYEDITIPEYLTNNTKYTLDEYRNYRQRITWIGNDVFNTDTYSNNTSNNIPFNPYAQYLKSITLPDSIEIIGGNAFQGTPLTQIVIPESVIDIGAGAFQNCTNLTSITLLSKKIKYIGVNAFYYSINLKGELYIPDSIVSIGSGAFEGTQITKVSVPHSYVYKSDSFPKGCEIIVRDQLKNQ